jgi:hypothetical protein
MLEGVQDKRWVLDVGIGHQAHNVRSAMGRCSIEDSNRIPDISTTIHGPLWDATYKSQTHAWALVQFLVFVSKPARLGLCGQSAFSTDEIQAVPAARSSTAPPGH